MPVVRAAYSLHHPLDPRHAKKGLPQTELHEQCASPPQKCLSADVLLDKALKKGDAMDGLQHRPCQELPRPWTGVDRIYCIWLGGRDGWRACVEIIDTQNCATVRLSVKDR
jgi:hypothetical protein